MGCGCGGPARRANGTVAPPRVEGQVASAETFLAAGHPRYLVVARQTSTDGKRFSTLTAAQDWARRSGGIIRQL